MEWCQVGRKISDRTRSAGFNSIDFFSFIYFAMTVLYFGALYLSNRAQIASDIISVKVSIAAIAHIQSSRNVHQIEIEAISQNGINSALWIP
jgi:hypothetical protein